MVILIDINILLDHLLKREPFYQDARKCGLYNHKQHQRLYAPCCFGDNTERLFRNVIKRRKLICMRAVIPSALLFIPHGVLRPLR